MKKENIQNGIAIQSGKTTDSMEKLTKLCEQEAEKMLSTIEIPENEIVSVPFWVQEPGFPNLSVWENSKGMKAERLFTN